MVNWLTERQWSILYAISENCIDKLVPPLSEDEKAFYEFNKKDYEETVAENPDKPIIWATINE